MYYYVDENGKLVSTESVYDLPEDFQDLFPETPPPQIGDTQFDAPVTGSSNSVSPQINIVTPKIDYQELADALSESAFFDSLVDTFANVPSYTVFPNTSAVAVMQDVLNGVNGQVGYFVVAGSTSSEVDMYYSKDYDVSGSVITLYSPVTHCKYYSYRPSGSTSTIYTYTVSDLGDTSVNLTNQLVYTNLVSGYPDLIPYKQRNLYDFNFLATAGIVLLALMTFSSRFRARRDK